MSASAFSGRSNHLGPGQYCFDRQTAFFRHQIIASFGSAFGASRRAINYGEFSQKTKPPAAAKTSRPVTLKHLAAAWPRNIN